MVSQIQAENDDEFFKEICHLIAMTQSDDDGQSIIADIYRNMPKMVCGEVCAHKSMEDRHESDARSIYCADTMLVSMTVEIC